MNSTALLFNNAFKMSVEQSAHASREKEEMKQHRDDGNHFAQLTINTHSDSFPTAELSKTYTEVSVSEWIAAVTMGKFALGQFATNISKKNIPTDRIPVVKKVTAATAVAQQQAISPPPKAASPKIVKPLTGGGQMMPGVNSLNSITSYSTETLLSGLSRKYLTIKPPLIEKIAPRLIRVLERENGATLYIRDYLQPVSQLQRDVCKLFQVIRADDLYQHVVINGINQRRSKL